MRRTGRLMVLGAALLAACADTHAYDEGMALTQAGKAEEGMGKLKEAMQTNPGDVKARQAYLRAQEVALNTAVEQGDRLLAKGAVDDARTAYRHALVLSPGNERAINGLAQVEAHVRQTGLMDAVDTLLARNQVTQARQKLDRVLAEAPTDPRAQALRRVLDAKLGEDSAQAHLAQVYRSPITIEFRDVSIKQLFEVISHSSGLNFIFDKDVKTDQKTSIFLKNSTIEAAVRMILMTNQLDQRVMDANTVLIYPNTQPKQKDYQELDVRTFYLANAEAKTIANTLKTILNAHDLAVDEKLNVVIMRDTPEALRMAGKLVAVEDVPDPEVMLDVEVLEVQRGRTQNLGVQWPASVAVQPSPLGTGVSVGSGSSSSGTSTGTSTSGSSSSSSSSVSLYDLTHQTQRSIGVSVPAANVNANLLATGAKLLTNPRIRVRNHEKAKILIGQRVPNITSTATSTGFLSQSVNYIDVGLTLNVEPTIYLDDNVGIKLTLEVSSIINQITTQTGTSAYQIGTRTASTSLRLHNGETDVLAGLIDSQERTSGNKLPGFGDVPLLGRLFGATTDDDQKTEIVLSITPHLVRTLQRPDAADAQFDSGTETSTHLTVHSGGGGSATSASTTATPSTTPSGARTPATPTGNSGLSNSGLTGVLGDGTQQSGTATSGGSSGVNSGSGVVDEGAAGAVPSAGSAQVQWQGPAQAAVGSTVTLNILAQATQPVTSLPMTLQYDATKLQVANIAEGPFLRGSGAATAFSSRLSGNGQLTLSDVATSGAGASSSGVYATVTFKALAAAAATTVQLVSSSPTGVDGIPITLSPPAPYSVQITAQ